MNFCWLEWSVWSDMWHMVESHFDLLHISTSTSAHSFPKPLLHTLMSHYPIISSSSQMTAPTIPSHFIFLDNSCSFCVRTSRAIELWLNHQVRILPWNPSLPIKQLLILHSVRTTPLQQQIQTDSLQMLPTSQPSRQNESKQSSQRLISE
jgi:hypothetical protein